MHLIYTNENNPATLKLLIAANFSRTDVEIVVIRAHDKKLQEPKRLPQLKTDDQRILFSSNVAAEYLFGKESSQEEYYWLEYESRILSPCLAHVIGNSSKLVSLKSNLSNALQLLDKAVAGKKYFTGAEHVGICDIVLWSALYPIYSDSNLCNIFINDNTKLLAYLKQLGSLNEFQEVKKRFAVTGAQSYNALQAGANYLLPNETAATSTNTEQQMNSPSHSEPVAANELLAAKEAWISSVKELLIKNKPETNPVLPVAGEKNILITSALPYVNNVPHLGNIIGCVLSADVFARFCRMRNYNTLFVCGTDEYGTATETKAMEEGLTPQQICDKYFEIHNSIYRWFNIGFDYFGRTTTPEQTKIVQQMFADVNENGFLFTETIEQLLCENCDRYLADRFVEGTCPHPGCNYEDARGDQCDGCGKLVNATELKNPRCKMCSKKPVVRNSKQFFLDLPKVEPLLLHWFNKTSSGWTNNARTITNSWMKEGLKPRCITRDLKWGVPVPLPDFKNKVFYVWFDAPIGYMSITCKYTKEWLQWWQPKNKGTEVSLYQFMAKDNVPFHSVMFPATLFGSNKGYTTVSHIIATEYLNYEDGKFSKSRGVGVFGNDAQETGIPSDVWRFYLLYIRPENQDSSFCWDDLATKNNSELLNNLGNFINRPLVFCEKFFDSVVPNLILTDDDYTFLALCNRELKAYIASLEKAKLRDGIRYILAISKHANQYMQSMQPWVLFKGNETDKERCGTVIGVCVNIVATLMVLLKPYMPDTSRTIKEQLNASNDLFVLSPKNNCVTNLIKPQHKIGKPAPLFAKIELKQVEELKKKYAGKEQPSNKKGPAKEEPKNAISNNSENVDAATVEAQIEEQALIVRRLKEGGAQKSEWQPQVEILLQLKKQLATLTGKPLEQPASKGKKSKK